MKKIFPIILALALSACSFGAQGELEQNKSKWQTKEIAHYKFSFSIGCFCPFSEELPLAIEVQNNEVISIVKSDGTPLAEDHPLYAEAIAYSTFERAFASLEADLKDADEVNVTYDPDYGFPAFIGVDYIKEAVDDEYSISITGFEILEP